MKTKELIVWGCIIVVIFAGLVVGWTFTPLYHHYKDLQRDDAQIYLKTNWYKISQDEKDFYIKKYNFNPDDFAFSDPFQQLETDNLTKSDSDNLIDKNPILKFLLGW
jgi:hypothetical protein